MGYFTGIKDLDELKEKYHSLCKEYHPDLGGDTITMQAINNEYSDILKNGFIDFGASTEEIEEALRDIIERAIVLDGLIIELCGRWIWFTGETYRWRKELKGIGCFFARKKKAWYWRPAEESRKGKQKTLTMDKIKEKYGAVNFKTKRACSLS